MSGAVFVDSNVPMYLIGAAHPFKERARALLDEMIGNKRRLVTSAEVLQEICHRYCAISRLEFIQPAFDLMYGVVDEVSPVTASDVEESKALLLGYQGLSARDALHAAKMRTLGISELFSFDRDFDRFVWIKRIS